MHLCEREQLTKDNKENCKVAPFQLIEMSLISFLSFVSLISNIHCRNRVVSFVFARLRHNLNCALYKYIVKYNENMEITREIHFFWSKLEDLTQTPIPDHIKNTFS